jgi:hypothetical protein
VVFLAFALRETAKLGCNERKCRVKISIKKGRSSIGPGELVTFPEMHKNWVYIPWSVRKEEDIWPHRK